MNILITGGTGFLGQALIRRLTRQGHLLFLLARAPKKARAVIAKLAPAAAANVTSLTGDTTLPDLGLDAQTLSRLSGRVDLVIHAAACMSFSDNDRDLLRKTNVEGTERVLQVTRALGARRFMHISTAYTMGTRLNGTEGLYPLERFNNAYEETKCQGEHLVFSQAGELDVSIYRPAIIIGDSRTGEADSTLGLYGFILLLERFRKQLSSQPNFAAKTFRIIANLDATINLVPVDYVCDVLEAGITHGEHGTIYNITNPTPPTIRQSVIGLACPKAGLPNVTLVAPSDALQLNDEEVALNRYVALFGPYMAQNKRFADGNTRKLLSAVGKAYLDLDFDRLKLIIDSYQGTGQRETSL